MKHELPPHIPHPCPKQWEEMSGGKKRRFCEQCQRHVHDLSELDSVRRQQLLSSPESVCVTFLSDSKGRLISFEKSHWILSVLFRMRFAICAAVAAILPFGLSSCANRIGGAPPMPDKTVVEPEKEQRLLGRPQRE